MNIVITAGGTTEKIDEVRKITNSSSGKLGKIIAETFLKSDLKIDTIFYICGKLSLKPLDKRVKLLNVGGTTELLSTVSTILTTNKIDLFIHSMAVSDYMVDYVTTSAFLVNRFNENLKNGFSLEDLLNSELCAINNNQKISSYEKDLIIKLKPTPKVISIIKKLSPKTLLVGFKLLNSVSDQTLIDVGFELLTKNNCDLVVANDIMKINEIEHNAIFINKNKNTKLAHTKKEIANFLVQFAKDGMI